MRLFQVLALVAALNVANAQTCKPAASDLITLQNVPAGGFPNPSGGPPVDNAKGSFGGENVNFKFTGGYAEVVPLVTSTGYWFFKFESRECWDATGYGSFEFDFVAPVGAKFEMTLTVHTSACLVNDCAANPGSCPRASDSTYVDITKYVVPNGQIQHAVIPFSAFNANADGKGTVDWRYIKDFTFISFTAIGQTHKFNNFIVKKGCAPGTVLSTASPVPGLGDWAFCAKNSDCTNSCCSKQYSNDGKYKCTPGGTPSLCTGAPPTSSTSKTSTSTTTTPVKTSTTTITTTTASPTTKSTTTTTKSIATIVNSPTLLGIWEFCSTSSQCAVKCCSNEYSDDGKFKCTPGGTKCVTSVTTSRASSPSPVSSLLKDWDFCTVSSQCANKCCSNQYSDDGKLKCTPGGGTCV